MIDGYQAGFCYTVLSFFYSVVRTVFGWAGVVVDTGTGTGFAIGYEARAGFTTGVVAELATGAGAGFVLCTVVELAPGTGAATEIYTGAGAGAGLVIGTVVGLA